jgi:hypothetical protein
MDKSEVIRFFGNIRKTALAFNVSTQAIYAWPDPIAEARALKAEKLSDGKLRYNAKDYAV